jgi:5-methylcytosine-specific restriction protein A
MNELPDTLPREYIIKAIHAYDSGFSHRFKEARLYELEFQGVAIRQKPLPELRRRF